MVKYLSGRQKLRPSDKLTEDRYQYLGLDQAEPNLADPATSPGVPSGLQYQLVAVTGYEGRRYWVPVGGSLQPGAITIFDEGTPVSSASSITQMNFVGAAVTAQVSLQNPSGHPGIAATVTVIPVTVGDSPPIGVGVTNNGELWWESDTGDLYVYYNDGNSSQWVMANAGGRGLTGDKGEKGEKGQKGDTGLTGGTGQKGEVGEKGAPSTVAGPAGDKGQKGEIGAGDKGQKGEGGAAGAAGDKGQKGEIGVGTKGDKGDGTAGGAQVTISDTAPTSPTPSNGDLWWESDTFDLHVYYQDGSSNQWVSITSNAALKGEKGDTGDKGQKGEVGQKGEIGDKGQKGEIGATGGTGGTGLKGQKGEVGATGSGGAGGDKGQKGEVGATGSQTFTVTNNGSSNYIIDGQNNPTLTLVRGFTYSFNVNVSGHPFWIKTTNSTGTGNGATGVTNNGAQTGTVTFVVPSNAPATLYYICQYHGSMVGTINTVDLAVKGDKGQSGDGDKGQKGDTGSSGTDAQLPVGTIVAYGGNSAPTGWQICNGGSTSTSALQTVLGQSTVPDLRDRFIIGAGNSYSRHDTGGSKDATLVSHSHTVDNHTHTFSGSGSHSHSHTTDNYVGRSNYAEPRNFGVGTDGNLNSTGGTTSATVTISISGNTGGSTPGTNSQGSSATNANLPPYYALIYIIKT